MMGSLGWIRSGVPRTAAIWSVRSWRLSAVGHVARRGIGAALLAAHHARSDRIGMPAVAEASSVRCGDPVDQPPMAASPTGRLNRSA